MQRRIGPDTAVRVGALIAVTLLHLPLIVAKRSRERPAIDEAALLVRFIAAPSEIEPERPLAELKRMNEAVPLPDHGTSRGPVEPSGSSATKDAPRTDWYLESASASRAAIDTLIRDESYRPLGPREKRFQIVEPNPPPPLFEEPRHRNGDIAPNPMGYDSVWHNKNCFTQLAQPVIPHRPRAPGEPVRPMNPITCMFPLGTPEPRGDLFEHLKKKRDKAPLPGERPPSR